MTYDGRMDDNTAAVIALVTLTAGIVAVAWLVSRAYVKRRRIEAEIEQEYRNAPQPWPDGHRWRDDVPAQTPLERDVTKVEGEN